MSYTFEVNTCHNIGKKIIKLTEQSIHFCRELTDVRRSNAPVHNHADQISM